MATKLYEPQRVRLMAVLSDFKVHTVPEINRRVYRLSGPTSARLAARVYDLRRLGFRIASNPTKKNSPIWWYQLLETPRNKTLLKA